MSPSITLDASETAKVKEAIQTTSNANKIYHAARARIYYAQAGTKRWSYAGIQGALVFILNTSRNTLHFQMVDLDGAGGVMWNYELHDGLVLYQEKSATFFLSFEGMVGGDVRCWSNSYLSVTDRNFRNVRSVSSSWMIQKQRPSTITSKTTKIQSLVSYLSLWLISDLITTVPAKPKRSSWMRSISKSGGNIDKSMISRPQEDGFVHVAHMGYAPDSGFTSTGVDPSWTALLEGSNVYLGKKVADDMASIRAIRDGSGWKPLASTKLPPMPHPYSRSQNPRRLTLPTDGPPPPAGRSLLPQSGGPLLPRETEPRQMTPRIPSFLRERYLSVFCFARSPSLFSEHQSLQAFTRSSTSFRFTR
jgi:neural Wiskott-Aldrich syndrome protein